jgi:hypothetical protein
MKNDRMKTAPQNTPNRHNHLFFSPILAGFALLAIFGLFLVPGAQAQSPVNELAILEIELWPDFDQPELLVLLTGTLADDVPTPARVTLPLPEEASVNAVAHVNVGSGDLENVSDVDSDTPGQLAFTTPSPIFRIEYYVPYESDGDRHVITFDWQSDMTIDELLTTVQQPAEASDFQLTPAADQTSTGGDGLVYHAIDGQALPAGQSFSVTASYDLPGGELSADVLAAQQPQVEGPLPLVSDPAQAESQDLNWPLVAIVAGGLIIIAAVAWFLYTNSGARRKRTPRPKPVRPTKPSSSRPSSSTNAQFCHNCGRPVDDEDQFCRACGTQLKGR